MNPAEAIKVRCQRDGISAAKVLAQLAKQATQHPGGTAAVVGSCTRASGRQRSSPSPSVQCIVSITALHAIRGWPGHLHAGFWPELSLAAKV